MSAMLFKLVCPLVAAGPGAYWVTFFLQWLNLLCANVGLVVLAGECLKVSCRTWLVAEVDLW